MCITEGTLRAYLDAELEPVERNAVAAHVAACDGCRARAAIAAARRNRVAGLVGALACEDGGDSAATALARFRLRVAARHPVPASRFAAALRVCAAAGMLAIVAVVIFLAAHASTGVDVPGHAEYATAPMPPTAARPGQASGPVVNLSDASATLPARSRRNHAVAHHTAADTYFLLTEDASPPEMGIVVRVTMPLSVLAGAGLTPRAGNEPEVKADVLVGQDGRARAIRFINETLTPGGK